MFDFYKVKNISLLETQIHILIMRIKKAKGDWFFDDIQLLLQQISEHFIYICDYSEYSEYISEQDPFPRETCILVREDRQ